MLYHIPKLMTPELLAALYSMGHGDELVITDGNFPASSHSRQHCIDLPGANSTQALESILSLLPVDSYVDNPFATMAVVDSHTDIPPAVIDFSNVLREVASFNELPLSLERFDFYARAKRACVIVRTSDRRPYANIILKKGVINEN